MVVTEPVFDFKELSSKLVWWFVNFTLESNFCHFQNGSLQEQVLLCSLAVLFSFQNSIKVNRNKIFFYFYWWHAKVFPKLYIKLLPATLVTSFVYFQF